MAIPTLSTLPQLPQSEVANFVFCIIFTTQHGYTSWHWRKGVGGRPATPCAYRDCVRRGARREGWVAACSLLIINDL